MQVGTTMALVIASLTANGLLTGATLDQAIKQLPARKKIGAVAYSDYSRAADLGNGLIWYPVLGVGTAVLSVVTGGFGLAQHVTGAQQGALIALIAGSVAHMGSTALAAPTNISQRRAVGDEVALIRIFDRFARLNAVRAGLMMATLGFNIWALVATVQS
jgi:hypothetical protein